MKPTALLKNRSRFFRGIALPLSFAVLALGCWTPSQTRQAAKDRLEAAKEKQDETQSKKAEIGVINTDSARRALQLDPKPSTNSIIAENRLDNAMVAFQSAGITPQASDILASRKAIDALLSTNLAMQVAASNHFLRLDQVLINLEERDKQNQDKIKTLEAKLEKIDRSNASDADTLASIKRWLWYGVLSIIGYFLFKVGWQLVDVWGMFNPAVKLGASMVKMPATALADGFAEVLKAGEEFKSKIGQSAVLSEQQKNHIIELFRTEHDRAQDQDTKQAIKRLKAGV